MNIHWGLKELVPQGAAAAWGARAILKNGLVDLVQDRQNATWESEASRSKFFAWLRDAGMPWLEDVGRRARGDSEEHYYLSKDEFHMVASPKASYGYLYIAAWMEETK